MCPQSKAQLGEKKNPTVCFYVRRRLGMSPRELATVLGCNDRSIRRWEAGKKMEAVYKSIFNWLRLQLDALNREQAAEWGQRVKDVVLLESPMAGLRELLTTPARTELLFDMDGHTRQLDDYGERKLAAQVRETARNGALEWREQSRSYFAALEEDRKQSIDAILGVKEFREVLEDPEKRDALATGLQTPAVFDAFRAQTLAALLAAPEEKMSLTRARAKEDPAVWDAFMDKLRAALLAAARKPPKRRGRRPR